MEYNHLKVDENRVLNDRLGPVKNLFSKGEKKSILSDISNKNNGKTVQHSKPRIKTTDEIDEMDKNDPYACAVYAKSIYTHMLLIEANFICKDNFFEHQDDLDSHMRSVLIDWIVDVHYKFKLQPETLFLCVNYLDRFLERQVVLQKELQLIGVSCLLIASKYEEIYFPKIKNFVALTDKSCSRVDILSTESLVAQTLEFSFTLPSIYQFILRYLKLCQLSLEFQCVAYYFSERSLLELKLSSMIPSKVAGACIVLAHKYVYGEYSWPDILQDQFKHTLEDLITIAKTLEVSVITADGTLQAIWRKYTRSVLYKASYIVHDKIGDSQVYLKIAGRSSL